MSEEEIIEEVEKELKLAKNIDDVATTIRNEYIEGLLDLYNKEKEKNKELLQDRKNYAEEYIHNNPWIYKQLNELYVFKTDVEKDYISKDKIKDKIEEYRYLMRNPKEAKHYVAWYGRKIDILEELLQ